MEHNRDSPVILSSRISWKRAHSKEESIRPVWVAEKSRQRIEAGWGRSEFVWRGALYRQRCHALRRHALQTRVSAMSRQKTRPSETMHGVSVHSRSLLLLHHTLRLCTLAPPEAKTTRKHAGGKDRETKPRLNEPSLDSTTPIFRSCFNSTMIYIIEKVSFCTVRWEQRRPRLEDRFWVF